MFGGDDVLGQTAARSQRGGPRVVAQETRDGRLAVIATQHRRIEFDSEVHDSIVADGAQSLIREQVEMGVAVRMAVLEALSRNLPNA